MRYENWDVLLFPEGSKTPIQEFRTQCFATRDLDSPYLHNQSMLDRPPSFYQPTIGQGGPGQVAVLTSFVPSMSRGSAFRVSIHSWEPPNPTKILQGLMQPDDSVAYVVKVFIDGYCISGSHFSNKSSWPHVIDLSAQVDKEGNQDALRFPPFHDEMLRHTHWDATEVYGRIRVIISEGVARPQRSPPFERVRDVIIFSFQHAPLHILGQSNIAWPNPSMWQQGPRPFIKYAVSSDVASTKDDEAHSHSPTRHDYPVPSVHERLQSSGHSMWPHRLYPTPPWPGQPTPWPERDARWGPPVPQVSAIPDPFVEPFKVTVPSRRNRSTLSDVPMPDYVTSTSSSSRDISGMTGSSNERNKEPAAPARMDDEQYNQLIEALSPKKFSSGASAPANTPTSAGPTATAETAKEPKSPELQVVEAQAMESQASSRAGSRTASTGRPGPLQELSQPESRVPSNASFETRDSEENVVIATNLLTPSGHRTSKTERRSTTRNSSEAGSVSSRNRSGGKLTVNPTDLKKHPTSSEGKRKRQMSLTDAAPSAVDSSDKAAASPTRKVSRFTELDDEYDLFGSLLEGVSTVVAVGGSDLEDE